MSKSSLLETLRLRGLLDLYMELSNIFIEEPGAQD